MTGPVRPTPIQARRGRPAAGPRPVNRPPRRSESRRPGSTWARQAVRRTVPVGAAPWVRRAPMVLRRRTRRPVVVPEPSTVPLPLGAGRRRAGRQKVDSPMAARPPVDPRARRRQPRRPAVRTAPVVQTVAVVQTVVVCSALVPRRRSLVPRTRRNRSRPRPRLRRSRSRPALRHRIPRLAQRSRLGPRSRRARSSGLDRGSPHATARRVSP